MTIENNLRYFKRVSLSMHVAESQSMLPLPCQVVVDAFDSSVLVSNCATKVFDFGTVPEKALHDIVIPLQLMVVAPTTVHGIACWFDVFFDGANNPTWLSTAPGLPTTHW